MQNKHLCDAEKRHGLEMFTETPILLPQSSIDFERLCMKRLTGNTKGLDTKSGTSYYRY